MIGVGLLCSLARRAFATGPRTGDGATGIWRSWRPKAWLRPLDKPEVPAPLGPTSFGAGLTLFHDCPRAEIGLAQIGADRPPHGVAVSVARFEGSYLSLVVDLPEDLARQLGARDVVVIHLLLDAAASPLARLNLRTGPNVITMARPLRATDDRRIAEFDLGRSGLGGGGVSAAWIDLLFDAASIGRICVGDLVVTRHRRAAF
ncbi:DUF6478 family protein [Citreimonas salinaria]|uniref:Uncharacterized protein n=1 Tax=Citreimonas salinaria TaxID=321339 RepID=A0A1H3L448_9RHOB|nr:DUF6478 family protein [Citreimonas salinaria]SDY59193.1 hypothetical protein SAMN05444340_11180 [Citreimonas salinaria]